MSPSTAVLPVVADDLGSACITATCVAAAHVAAAVAIKLLIPTAPSTGWTL